MTETQKLIRFCYIVGIGMTLNIILSYIAGVHQHLVRVSDTNKLFYYSTHVHIIFGPLLLSHAVASILKYFEDE